MAMLIAIRRIALLGMAFVMVLAVGIPAYAGGWAVTTVDAVNGETVAGEEFEVIYTILQHGRTPVNVDETALIFRRQDVKQEIVVPGIPTGKTGTYVAHANLPAAGNWLWTVDPGWFEDQPLGTIEIGQPVGAVASPVPQPGGAITFPTQVLALGAALFAAICGLQIASRRLRLVRHVG